MTAGQGQALLDIAVQYGGKAEVAWEIAFRSGVGLTDEVSGMELDVPSVPAEPDTVDALSASGAKPATEGSPEQHESRAIGTAKIGTDKIC